MNKKKKLKRILNSKILVIMALLFVWIGASTGLSKVKADTDTYESYKFGTVYQYYMLYNQKDEFQSDAKKQTVASMGNFGSGGISGTFSYDDIVNNVDTKAHKNSARDFASTMATYSTFGYMSNRIQGFASVVPMIGRALSGIILIPLALVEDILTQIIPSVVALIAKLNVITFLGNAIAGTNFTSDLQKAIGLSTGDVKTFVNAALTFAIVMILISLVFMLRRGSARVDQMGARKLRGRLISLIALPIIVSGSAYLLQDASSLASKSIGSNATFAKFLIDDRTWAYQYNFTPDGSDATNSSGINPSKNSYVDNTFNPYSSTGQKRIQAINKNSTLTTGGFPNSSLVLAYVTGQSFSAEDYINYQGSAESDSKSTYGSYYAYANQMSSDKHLVDTSKMYYGGDTAMPTDLDVKSPFISAKDDYIKTNFWKDVTGKKGSLAVSPQVAWRDRYIYGAKSSGAEIDKYYGEVPSWEQIMTVVGTQSSNKSTYALSDQTMYLALSTIFNETGGSYYIDAPARGIMQTKASFDSTRSSYYVVSMVGNPFFTLLGLITAPLIQLVVFIAVIFAVMSIGLLDMNVRPLRAWAKGIFLGDLEYPEAFLIYAVGIAGTILVMVVVPSMLVGAMQMASNLVTFPFTATSNNTMSPQSAMSIDGLKVIASSIMAFGFGWAFLKSEKFRKSLISVFTLVWAWARETGQRLEQQASPNMNRISGAQEDMYGKGSQKAGKMAGFASSAYDKYAPDGLKNTLSNLNDPEKSPLLAGRRRRAGFGAGKSNSDSKPKIGDANALARHGIIDRARNTMGDIAEQGLHDNDDPMMMSDVQNAQNAVDDFDNDPNKENLQDAEQNLESLRSRLTANNADPDAINSVDRSLNELHSMDKKYGIDTPKTDEDADVDETNGVGDTGDNNVDTDNDEDKATASEHLDKNPEYFEKENGEVNDNQSVKNPDGTITRSDGSIENPDGTVTKPDGSIENSDGTVTKPDGSIENSDGTITKPDGTVVKPDGTIVDSDDRPDTSEHGTSEAKYMTDGDSNNKDTEKTGSDTTDSNDQNSDNPDDDGKTKDGSTTANNADDDGNQKADKSEHDAETLSRMSRDVPNNNLGNSATADKGTTSNSDSSTDKGNSTTGQGTTSSSDSSTDDKTKSPNSEQDSNNSSNNGNPKVDKSEHDAEGLKHIAVDAKGATNTPTGDNTLKHVKVDGVNGSQAVNTGNDGSNPQTVKIDKDGNPQTVKVDNPNSNEAKKVINNGGTTQVDKSSHDASQTHSIGGSNNYDQHHETTNSSVGKSRHVSDVINNNNNTTNAKTTNSSMNNISNGGASTINNHNDSGSHIVKNMTDASRTVSNAYNTQHIKNIKNLRDALGSASHNADVSKAIEKLSHSSNKQEFGTGVSHLQNAISHLDKTDRSRINQENTTKTLKRMVYSLGKDKS